MFDAKPHVGVIGVHFVATGGRLQLRRICSLGGLAVRRVGSLTCQKKLWKCSTRQHQRQGKKMNPHVFTPHKA